MSYTPLNIRPEIKDTTIMQMVSAYLRVQLNNDEAENNMDLVFQIMTVCKVTITTTPTAKERHFTVYVECSDARNANANISNQREFIRADQLELNIAAMVCRAFMQLMMGG